MIHLSRQDSNIYLQHRKNQVFGSDIPLISRILLFHLSCTTDVPFFLIYLLSSILKFLFQLQEMISLNGKDQSLIQGISLANLPYNSPQTRGMFEKRYKYSIVCQLLSHVLFIAIAWTVAHQAPLSMGFSRQEYWSGLPFPSPGDLPHPGIEPGSPVLQANSLLSESAGKQVQY